MYSEYEIRQMRLSIPRQRRMVEAFLQDNALRLDDVDYYAGVFRVDGDEMLAGGGLKGSVVKCLAVRSDCRDEALSCRMVSHLVSVANAAGHQVVRLFTKPSNRVVFESMSFRLLAEAPEAILMETGVGGIDAYRRYLGSVRDAVATDSDAGEAGVIVMNANPFTLGHRYLVEQAAQKVARLYVIAVKEEASLFSYDERLAMIRSGVSDINNVTVCEGSDYAVSATTFPTYFLKRLSDASDTQMMLDIDLFRRHIAPALGTTVRFVGSEPTDMLTRRYNEIMKQMLPRVVETERLTVRTAPREAVGDTPAAVSASLVRAAMGRHSLWEAASMVPQTSVPYIIAHLATQALQAELDTTPKPGLVDCHDNGAHTDMDYALMCRSIHALHPYFTRLAVMGSDAALPSHESMAAVGMEAECAMFAATGGVNTHKGALFSMGLAVVSVAHEAFVHGADNVGAEAVRSGIMRLAAGFPDTCGTHGSAAKRRAMAEEGAAVTVKGALDNAREGYPQLFGAWLPYCSAQLADADPLALHRTLLRIMCDIDDTNIIFRAGMAVAEAVKEESEALLEGFSEAALQRMNTSFVERNISPGGSADMLSLTLFVCSVCRQCHGGQAAGIPPRQDEDKE